MSAGGALRTNFRIRGAFDIADSTIQASALGAGMIGSGLLAGSFFPALAGGVGGASNPYGGFVVGSFASLLVSPGWVQISALGALSAYWGTVLGAAGSGYRIIPFDIIEMSANPSFVYNYKPSITQAFTSIDSIFVIAAQLESLVGGSAGSVLNIGYTSAGGTNVRFMWFGWIVSTP